MPLHRRSYCHPQSAPLAAHPPTTTKLHLHISRSRSSTARLLHVPLSSLLDVHFSSIFRSLLPVVVLILLCPNCHSLRLVLNNHRHTCLLSPVAGFRTKALSIWEALSVLSNFVFFFRTSLICFGWFSIVLFCPVLLASRLCCALLFLLLSCCWTSLSILLYIFVRQEQTQANSLPCSAGYVESTRAAMDRRREGMLSLY